MNKGVLDAGYSSSLQLLEVRWQSKENGPGAIARTKQREKNRIILALDCTGRNKTRFKMLEEVGAAV
jgi:hypothetical protein